MTLTINNKTYEAGELVAYVEKLEQENAELKERLFKVENAYKRKSEAEWRLNELYQKALTDFANAEKCSREYFARYRTMLDFLIKAKEIIKKFLLWENDWHNKAESKYELLKQAEQFLREIK